MGIFIKNEQEWMNYKQNPIYIQNIPYEPIAKLSSLNDYFSGYYMDIHHEVRSGSEHNLCRILQLLNIDYDYEFYTFKLDNNKTYRPDFYILNEDTFYEMKGEWRGNSQEKLELFRKIYPSIKLILIDMPTCIQIEKYSSTLFNIDFNKHIRIKNRLVRHIPQFRHQLIQYNNDELNYHYYTNKISKNDLDKPINVSDNLNKLLEHYRNTGKIYYAFTNTYYYNYNDIQQLKNELKSKQKIVTPRLISSKL